MSNALSVEAYVVEQLPAALPRNRGNSPILPAGLSDEDVVIRWLKTKAAGEGGLSETTLSQYVVEARRLFWYARWIGLPISEWSHDEAGDYLTFLRDPDPAALSQQDERGKPVRVPRDDPSWTPFRKPLSAASARQSQVIAGSLFKWLVAMQYLKANPFAGFGLAGKRKRAKKKQSRFVGEDGLELARMAVAGRDCKSDRQRAKRARDLFVLDLFTKTGLRTTEAVDAKMGAIRYARLSPAERARDPSLPEGVWVIDVEVGKGGEPRTVSCDAIMGSLQEYRLAYGLPPLPARGETTPLILGARRRTPALGVSVPASRMRAVRQDLGAYEGITDRSSVYRLVKKILRDALAYWSVSDPLEADRLQTASTHWLRHSFAKSLSNAGASLQTIARNLGHVDVNTSLVYIDDEEHARALETQRLLKTKR
ncbi:MAG: site-specific integrase [Pseudomonadota bacterium]